MFQIIEDSLSLPALKRVAKLSCAFQVTRRIVLERLPDLVYDPVDPPWTKDYDAIPGNHPTDLLERLEPSRWRVLRLDGGAAIVGFGDAGYRLTPETFAAVLLDLRVAPAKRSQGRGTQLYEAAARWAKAQGAQIVIAETQDINADACEFYAAMGARPILTALTPYPDFKETQILWRRDV